MIYFDFFGVGPGLVSISEMFLTCAAKKTVQYSEQKHRPVQTSDILDFFKGDDIIKPKAAMLGKKCFRILGWCYKSMRV